MHKCNFTEGVKPRIDVVKKHETSAIHQKALNAKKRANAQSSATAQSQTTAPAPEQPSLQSLFDKIKQDALSILTQRLKIVYHLARQGRPLSDFKSQMELQEALGTPHLELNAAFQSSVKYDSQTFVAEAVSACAEYVWRQQLAALQASPTFSILIDESTDSANISELIMYLAAMGANGEPFCTFGDLVQLEAGDALHITSKLLHWLNESGLDLSKLSAFGSDGASTMTGAKNGALVDWPACSHLFLSPGVVAKLKTLFPHLFDVHCVAHRLALCCKDASDAVDYISKTFLSTVLVVANWFDNSAVRTADLHKRQLANAEDTLKIIKALAARWLSSDRAVQHLRISLKSVIQTMQDPKRKNEAGIGCVKILSSFLFIATLELFADTLPHLSKLSLVFQSRRIDFSSIAAQVSVTRQVIQGKNALASAAAKPEQAGEGKDAKGENSAAADPVMEAIERKLSELRAAGIDIVKDNEQTRKQFSSIRAQWLQALDDRLTARFPETQLFSDLCTIFTPSKLPASVAESMSGSYGQEEIKRIAERLSITRPPLPSLDAQLRAVTPLTSEEKKAAKAAAKERKAADDDDVVMLDAPASSSSSSSSSTSSSSSSSSASAASAPAAAFAGKAFVNPMVLQAEWITARSLLIDLRDNDPTIKAQRSGNARAPDTQDLVRAFLTTPVCTRSCPETAKLAALAVTIPVATAEPERGYSTMNYIKDELRNRLNEERLNDLMRIYLHGPPLTAVDWRAILFIWYSRKARKVLLPALVAPAVAAATSIDAEGDSFML